MLRRRIAGAASPTIGCVRRLEAWGRARPSRRALRALLTMRRKTSTNLPGAALRCLSALCAHGTRQKTQRCRKFDQQCRHGLTSGGVMSAIGYLLAFSAVFGVAMSGMAADARAQENLDRDQIRSKTVRGKLRPVPQERARSRQGADQLHAVVLPAPALHEQQRVGGYAHRLSAIGRHAARQGESRREEIAGEQGAGQQGRG